MARQRQEAEQGNALARHVRGFLEQPLHWASNPGIAWIVRVER
jgi:hypothetical protein